MGNVNVVVIEGNLVRAAELSRWSDGTPYCKFTVANNETYKDAQGNYQDIPSFIDCQCKGNFAESMSRHLLKGRRVIVTGRLKQQSWQDEQGQKHSRIVVKVQELSLSPLKNDSDNSESWGGGEQGGQNGNQQRSWGNKPQYSGNNNQSYSNTQDAYDMGGYSESEMFGSVYDDNEIPF